MLIKKSIGDSDAVESSDARYDAGYYSSGVYSKAAGLGDGTGQVLDLSNPNLTDTYSTCVDRHLPSDAGSGSPLEQYSGWRTPHDGG